MNLILGDSFLLILVVTFPTVVLILLTEILRLVTGWFSNMSMLVPVSERDRESACSVKARTETIFMKIFN